jgi:predicted metal-dependent hydrolase
MAKITLKGKEISYELKKSQRARRARLCVYAGGNLTVTMPKDFSIERMENFILEKADWILKKINLMKNSRYNPIFHKYSNKEYKKYKNQASILARKKVEELNRIYGFDYNRISIRNSRSRWGSCSENKNLNFNYKILFLPEDLLNYIIIHELCHLGEMNHSRKFWNLVEKTIPDYREMRKKIRKI